MYRIHFLTHSRLVLTHPHIVKELFRVEHSLLRERDFGMSWLLEEILGDCLFTKYGKDWKRLLSAFSKKFGRSQVLEQGPIVDHVCQSWIDSLLDKAKSSSTAVTIDVTDLERVPFEIVCRLIYGAKISDDTIAELAGFCKQVDFLTSQIFEDWKVSLPGYKYLPPRITNLKRRLQDFKRRWASFNREMMKRTSNHPDSILFHVVNGMETKKWDITEKELFDTLTEIVLANADFVAAAVGWPLLHLHSPRNQWVNQKLQMELENALQGRDKLTVKEVSDLPYLNAVLKESWRMEPMMLITNPVVLGEEMKLDGFVIPQGTRVVIDTKAINNHPSEWNEPHLFRPERFEKPPSPTALHIFGLGSRRCLGQHYATLICKYILVSILENFGVEIEETKQEASYGPFQFPSARFKLTPIQPKDKSNY